MGGGESNSFTDMQLVYSTAPADLAEQIARLHFMAFQPLLAI